MGRAGILVLVVVSMVGCGESFSLDGLEGRYDITSAVQSYRYAEGTPNCVLDVAGSRASADCSRTSDDAHETLSVAAGVSEDEIRGELTHVADYELEAGDPCYQAATVTTVVSATASRSEGRETSGVFAALAGEWTGSLAIEERVEVTLVADPDDWCPQNDIELTAVSFDASVDGNTAAFTWSSDGESGRFDVIGTDGAIQVGDEVVPR